MTFPLGGRCPSAHTGADEGHEIDFPLISQKSKIFASYELWYDCPRQSFIERPAALCSTPRGKLKGNHTIIYRWPSVSEVGRGFLPLPVLLCKTTLPKGEGIVRATAESPKTALRYVIARRGDLLLWRYPGRLPRAFRPSQ